MRFLRYSVIFLGFIINMSSYWVHDLKSFVGQCNTRQVLWYLYLPEPNGKSRDQNPGPKLWRFRKSLRIGIRTFPTDYQHRWLFVSMVTNSHRSVEVYDTDRYQWQPSHHWWPMVVLAAEGISPNARVDSTPCWRGAASTIEQLKWFREFSRQNAEYSFVLLEVTCSPLVNMQIFGS